MYLPQAKQDLLLFPASGSPLHAPCSLLLRFALSALSVFILLFLLFLHCLMYLKKHLSLSFFIKFVKLFSYVVIHIFLIQLVFTVKTRFS